MSFIIAGPSEAQAFLQTIASGLADAGTDAQVHPDLIATMAPDTRAQCELLITIGTVGAVDMEQMPALHSIITPTLGYDGVDVAHATRKGILVANGQVTENVESMAEANMLLILAALYDLPGAMARFHRDQAWTGGPRSARMLKRKTIGLIGYGNIARALCQRLAGWGTDILLFSRHPTNGAESGAQFVPLDILLSQSDVVVLLSALTPDRHHLLNADRLAAMKTGAILVNTARGGLVDQDALAEQVRTGRLSKVALDVFETEPLPGDSIWRTMPNAILTPHMIGQTVESTQAIIDAAIRNGLEARSGRAPQSAINPDVLPHWRGSSASSR